jgi:P-type Ca2+ transporter type 2C
VTQAVASRPGDIGDASVTGADAVAAALEVDVERGLSAREAARRLAHNRPNELRAAPPVPTWRRVLAQFQDPLIYLLLAAVAVALVAWWVEGTGAQGRGWPVDAIVIAAVVLHGQRSLAAARGVTEPCSGSSLVAAGGVRHQRTATMTPQAMTAVPTIAAGNPVPISVTTIML